MRTTTVSKVCGCGAFFEATRIEIMGASIEAAHCPDCDNRIQAAWERTKAEVVESAGQTKTRAARFEELAKAAGFRRYLAFDPAFKTGIKIPADKGMILAGPTGKGKTFLAVELIRRYHANGASVHLIDSVQFGWDVATTDSQRREDAVRKCVAADWLLFDDLAKVAITPRVAEALFYVANQRENAERRTIWTTNATDAQLRERLPAEYANPFLERMYRTCETVIFQ